MARTFKAATVIAAAASLAACASLQPATPEVFLLMGQSNMSGRGALEDAPKGALDPERRICVLGNDGITRVAREPIDSAIGQVDEVSADKAAGIGPGLAFAKARVRETRRPILLVPCAKGGTSITLWARSDRRDTLYGSCIARAREAARSGVISGVLWYQGESDAATQDLASAWAGRFAMLVQDLRQDLGDPHLAFAVVAIGDPPVTGKYAGRFPFWAIVQTAQTSLDIPGVTVVAARGLPRNADELHISTAGQIELGQRLAAVLRTRDAARPRIPRVD